MAVVTNDNTELAPRTSFDGPVLEFDLPGLEIGVAEYDEGPTGCTVFHFPDGVATQTDVRGGAVGTFGNWEWNHAICLTGGSLYGLEACSGVAAELFARRAYSVEFTEFGLVSGAICYDYGPRESRIYPDKELGRAALRSAVPGRFPLGRRGAGRSATVGKTLGFDRREPGGQGGAFRRTGDMCVAAFVVANSAGAVVARDGNVVRGHLDPKTGERPGFPDIYEARLARGEIGPSPPASTTLSVVVTNARLGSMQLRQLGRLVHASMSRAIQPFHDMSDGDVLYAVTTNAVDAALDDTALGVLASELMWDAVLSAVQQD